MVKAVIFDMDGLLLDTEIVSHRIYAELLAGFGQPFTTAEYAMHYSGKSEIKNVTTLIETYHLPWTLEQGLKQVLDVEVRLLAEGVALKTGAKELLSYLKEHGYRIAIASSSTTERAHALLAQHDILGYFEQEVFAEEIPRGKPNPDIFLRACEKLGELPENCLVLEDSEAGITAAHAAGIPVICIPDMKRPAQEYVDKTSAMLPDLSKVIDYLEALG